MVLIPCLQSLLLSRKVFAEVDCLATLLTIASDRVRGYCCSRSEAETVVPVVANAEFKVLTTLTIERLES